MQLGGETLLTWEITFCCYQKLMYFYKVVSAVWEHLVALLSWSKSGPLIISRMFGPCSLQGQEPSATKKCWLSNKERVSLGDTGYIAFCLFPKLAFAAHGK